MFEITQPAFDPEAKPESNCRPVKSALLPKPTATQTPAHTHHLRRAMLEHPAAGLEVGILLGDCSSRKPQALPRRSRGSLTYAGSFWAPPLQNRRKAAKGAPPSVRRPTALTQKATKLRYMSGGCGAETLRSLAASAGAAVVGCEATVAEGENKLNMCKSHTCALPTVNLNL